MPKLPKLCSNKMQQRRWSGSANGRGDKGGSSFLSRPKSYVQASKMKGTNIVSGPESWGGGATW